MTVFKDQLSRVNIDPLITDGQHLLNMLRGNTDNDNLAMKSLPQRTYPLDYFDEARKISLVNFIRRYYVIEKDGRYILGDGKSSFSERTMFSAVASEKESFRTKSSIEIIRTRL